MRQNTKELHDEILSSLQAEAKCTRDLVADLAPRFSARQIENALSDLLDLRKIVIGSDPLRQVRPTTVLKYAATQC